MNAFGAADGRYMPLRGGIRRWLPLTEVRATSPSRSHRGWVHWAIVPSRGRRAEGVVEIGLQSRHGRRRQRR